MTTRRDFLKASALLAAGAVLPKTFNINSITNPKVLIMGAGFSGIAAAYKLVQKGFDVTVLEARNRISGRVFSFEIDKAEKLVIELGGEWVGASHTRIQELCKEFGLILENNQMDTHLIYGGQYSPKGKWSYSSEWKDAYGKMMADYKNFTDDDKKKM